MDHERDRIACLLPESGRGRRSGHVYRGLGKGRSWIRHARSQPFPVVPLAIAVIEPSLGALLVSRSGLSSPAGIALPATGLAAVSVPSIAGTADEERPVAVPASPDPEWRLHAPRPPGIRIATLWTDAETDAILGTSNTSPRARHRGPGAINSGPSLTRDPSGPTTLLHPPPDRNRTGETIRFARLYVSVDK